MADTATIITGNGVQLRNVGLAMYGVAPLLVAGLSLVALPLHAGTRYAERNVVPITLGQNSVGEPLGMNQPNAGDLNHDGFADIIFTTASGGDPFPDQQQSSSIVILKNNAGSGYSAGTSDVIAGTVPTTWPLRQILIADFNGDGRNDVFGESTGFDDGVHTELFAGGQNLLLLSGPDGKLHDVTSTNLPQISDFSHGSTVADVDKDGDLDIWVNTLPNDNAQTHSYLMLNDGNGAFSVVADLGLPANQIVGINGRLPAALVGTAALWSQFVDADKDGDPDLYLGYVPTTGRTWLLLNDGSGHFTDAGPNAIPQRTFDGIGQAEGAAVADVDGDGYDDLLLYETPFHVVTNCPGSTPTKAVVALLMSNGNGTFRDETFLRTTQSENCRTFVNDFALLDINGDGAVDIALQSFPDVEFLLNNGHGFFTRLPANWVDTDPPMGFVFIPVDVDNDSDWDFVENRELDDETSLIKAIAPTASSPNFAPIALPDSYTKAIARQIEVAADEGVLANDIEPDKQKMTAALIQGTAHGSVTLSPDGSFAYIPDPGFTGTDVFTYAASDGSLSSAPVSVSIKIDVASVVPVLMFYLNSN